MFYFLQLLDKITVYTNISVSLVVCVEQVFEPLLAVSVVSPRDSGIWYVLLKPKRHRSGCMNCVWLDFLMFSCGVIMFW